jgi:DNA-binding CsgD family transcriptional regulator
MFAPEMAPGWLKVGDYTRLPEETLPFALYLRVKYLQNRADYPQMLAVAQTTITFLKGKGVVMYIELLLMCASACVGLGERDRAREYLLEALALGMPYGFITPFVENVANLTGLVEECVERRYPDAYGALLAQWQYTWKNWALFHNRFARDNVPLILTLRELRIATLAASRMPYAQIARQECLSVGRVRNIVQEIYGKLLISSRDELAALVLWKMQKT